MKIFLMMVLGLSLLSANYCFKDKSARKTICYEKYFQRKNIYKAKSDETYYTSKRGDIYAISDKIEIKFNRIGAVISLEKDFEITFFDKLKNDTYIFKVKNPHELFSILSNLNDLDSIQRAVPQRTKKYTQREIQKRREERKARLKKMMKKIDNKKSKKESKKFLEGQN